MDFIVDFVLVLGMIAGLISIPFGLPGAAIILLSVFVYALYTNFNAAVGMPFFIVLCALAAVAETADNWLAMAGARRYGASRGAMWLSMAGGLLGAVFIGGPLILIAGPLGPVAAGFAGAFLAVFGYEYYKRKNGREALRIAWGSFLGRMAGIVLKIVIAAAMIIAVLAALSS